MPTITISAAEAAEGDELLQQISIENYAFVAAAALITYEHFLVMKQEIELISDHKITSVACILLNRLSMTGIAVTNVLLMLPWSNPTRFDYFTLYHYQVYLANLTTALI